MLQGEKIEMKINVEMVRKKTKYNNNRNEKEKKKCAGALGS